MLNLFRRRDLMVRLLIGVILGFVCVMLVITLIPGFGGGTTERDSASIVAELGDQQITIDEVQRGLSLVSRNNPIPPTLYPIYARVILDQIVLSRLLEQEGKRLGVQVTDFEVAEQIRQSPLFSPGGSFIGKERYQDLVEQRFGMTVSEFEKQIKSDLLGEKIRAIVTDGVVVTPAEVEREFKRRNEKVKIEYVNFSQGDEAKVLSPSQAELEAWFQANRSRYPVPEKRRVKYIYLDPHRMREELKVSDEQIRQYYQRNLEVYRVPERVHASHILFKTVGKTGAEVEQIRQKSLDVLRRLKRGAKFDELARQYSEDDGTKNKGGDLSWLLRGQTVPEFEQAAFTLAKGTTSDLVQTMYGFHIIRVLEKQEAHLQPLEEVSARILPMLQQEEFEKLAEERSSRISDALHRGGKPIETVAQQFDLPVRESALFAREEGGIPYGLHPDFNDAAFRLRLNETSGPVRAAGGIMFLKVVEIQKAHQGELSEPEVAAKVSQDHRNAKGLEIARRRAREFSERVRKGSDFALVAKEMGVQVQNRAAFSRSIPIPELGPAREFFPAFEMPVGGVGGPVDVSPRFIVYRVLEHEQVDRAAFERERAAIETQVLDQKRTKAFELFSDGLKQAMIRAGKLKIHDENLKRLARSS